MNFQLGPWIVRVFRAVVVAPSAVSALVVVAVQRLRPYGVRDVAVVRLVLLVLFQNVFALFEVGASGVAGANRPF
jgi:hypothetical protein